MPNYPKHESDGKSISLEKYRKGPAVATNVGYLRTSLMSSAT